MLVVNCRKSPVTTPPEMARVLRQLALDFKDKLATILRGVAPQFSATVSTAGDFKAETKLTVRSIEDIFSGTLGDASDLTAILASYEKFVASVPKDRPAPIIVIGEHTASAAPAPCRCCPWWWGAACLLQMTQLPLKRGVMLRRSPFLLQTRPTCSWSGGKRTRGKPSSDNCCASLSTSPRKATARMWCWPHGSRWRCWRVHSLTHGSFCC